MTDFSENNGSGDQLDFSEDNAAGEGLFEPEPTDEPTDEEIGDVADDETEELTEKDIAETLQYLHAVLVNHEQAIGVLAAAIFGGLDESQVSDEGTAAATDSDSEGVDAEVIPITTDITGTIKP